MENKHRMRVESGYRRRTRLVTGLTAAVLLSCGATVWAHHSYAMFDMEHPVEVKGTVKEFSFVNPHSSIILAVKDHAGKTSDFTIATGGPFNLARSHGWKRNSLKFGDVIVAVIHPLRDGSPGGDLIKVTRSDGSELIARDPSTPVPTEKKTPAEKK